MCTNCNQNSSTPCGCNDGVYQEVNICNQCPPEQPCDCPIKDLSTDCVLYNQEDISCKTTIVVPKNTNLSVALPLIVKWACTRFEEMKTYFRLLNIGIGAEIYAGNTLIGEKKLRKINSNSPLITVVQNPNDISIGADTNAIIALQKKYAVANIGTGEGVYKDATILGNNIQFNLKKLNASSPILTVVSNPDDISIGINQIELKESVRKNQRNYGVLNVGTGEGIYKNTTELENYSEFNFKKLKSNTLDISTNLNGDTIQIDIIDTNFSYYYINSNYPATKGDGSIIRPFNNWDEARVKMIGIIGTDLDPQGRPVSILYPKNPNVTFILQTNTSTAYNPTINTLSVKFIDTSLTYTGNDVYMIDSEVLYPLVPKDVKNEITQSITFNLFGVGRLIRTTVGGYIRSIGAKRGSSITTNNPNTIIFGIGENENDILYLEEFVNYPNSIWEGDVLKPDGVTLLGNDYNPPKVLKWTTQVNPTNPLVYVKNNSFGSFTYPVLGKGNLYIETFVNTGLHVENTNINLNKLTILPYSYRISVVQGNTFVPSFPGVYEPKNAPAIYSKDVQWFLSSLFNVNGGTFNFNGFDTFFKIEGFFIFNGSTSYDTNHYIKTFADLSTTTQNNFKISGLAKISNLNSNINYLINSSVIGDFYLFIHNSSVKTVKNISQNLNTNIIPITNGLISSINDKPYLSGIDNYVNDAGARIAGLLQNALYFNTANNAIDKV
jgi:hypothetical protein